MSCADGGSGGRGGRRSTKRSSPRSSRNVKFEPPPSPIRVARDRPDAETVRVEERLDRSSTISGGLSAMAAMLRAVRRRLYLMRHAEVSYVGERDPEVVRLTERGLEQAAAAHRALADVEFDLVVTSGAAAHGRDGGGRRPGPASSSGGPTFAEWRGGRLDDVAADELEQLFVGALQVRDEAARFLGGESLGEALDRVLPAFERLIAREWETALAVFHGGVNRILLSHALAGGRTYFGTFEQAPACINVLDLGADGTLDRPHGELHPVRPAASGADDDDGAPLGELNRGSTTT